MKLFINGFQIELPPNVKIAKTIQANDIASVSTRQASYTNTFDIPLTSSNIKAFKMLSIEGNNSNIPYQKNAAYLFSDSGEAIVNNGWALITETAKGFKCNLYDGVIDLYKSIQNFTLADLDITALQHDKTPTEVLSTQTLTKPYAYILADYNGNPMVGTNINTDYLVPAVKVTWLMDKIEQFSGFTFSGSFKTNPDYTNLYLTTPKATPPVITGTILSASDIYPDRTVTSGTPPMANVSFNTPTITGTKISLDSNSITINANQNVKIKATFVLNPNILFVNPDGSETYAYAVFNGQGFLCDGTIRTISANYDLFAGQSIEFPILFYDTPTTSFALSDFFTSATIEEFTNDSLFEQELGGLKITDFLNEIVWRFNLTLFKGEGNNYIFKYLSEIINATSIDWSDKFIDKNSETYTYGEYAQVNEFNLRYDDENSEFNNGQITVSNTNLPANKVVVKSITYSPELNPTSNLPFSSRVYKFWQKEPKENGSIVYKPLSNRFFFIKPSSITLSTNFESEVLGTTVAVTSAQRENFNNLDYKSIVNTYYADMSALLNKSKIINVSLRLTERDIATIDLSKPVYIKQLGGSYLINKISNFIPYQNTKVELIKINK